MSEAAAGTNLLLGQYQVLSAPVSGGMGSVYKVHHTGWNIDLAMKVPHAGMFDTPEKRAIFQHECETWMHLGLHPNTVSCFYVRDVNGVPSVFSEWMDGGSLADLIASRQLYDEMAEDQAVERILDIAIQFARGLQHSHERGLIHQDVKPANVMLSKEGEVKVCDFGLANAVVVAGLSIEQNPDEDGSLYVNGLGYTQTYASPEQLNTAPIKPMLTKRTDIYSWAVSVVEMFFGECIWMVGSVVGVYQDYYFEEGEIIVPEALRPLLRRCLETDQQDRPHSFADIIGDPDPEGSKGFLPVEKNLLEIYRELFNKEYPRELSKAAADSADSLNNQALSYLDMGDEHNALECWQQALTIDKTHLQSVYNYNLYLWRKAEITDVTLVRELGEAARSIHTADSARLFLQVFLDLGDREGAAEWASKLESFHEQDPATTAILNRAKLLLADIGTRSISCKAGELSFDYYCLSSDLQMMLACTVDTGNAVLFKGNDGRILKTLSKDRKGGLWDCCISHNNKMVLLVFTDFIEVYELPSGKYQGTLIDIHGFAPESRFSPDDKLIAVCAGSTIHLWDALTHKSLLKIEQNDEIRHIAFTPDSRKIVSASFHGELCVWDLSNGNSVKKMEWPQSMIRSLCVVPDGIHALTGDEEGNLRIWNLESGQCLHTFRQLYPIIGIRVNSDSKSIVCVDKGNYYYIWDLQNWRCLSRIKSSFRLRHNFEILNGRICDFDYERLNSCKIQQFTYWAEWEICRIRGFSERSEQEARLTELKSDVRKALDDNDFNSALNLIEEAGQLPGHEKDSDLLRYKYQAALYCRKTGVNWVQRKKTSHIEKCYFESFDYQHDLAFVKNGDRIDIIRLCDNTVLRSQRKENYEEIITPCPDGKTYIFISKDAGSALFDIETGVCLHQFEDDLRTIDSVKFSPDRKNILFICSTYNVLFRDPTGKLNKKQKPGNMRLFEIESGKCLQQFNSSFEQLDIVMFSPDTKYILSISRKNSQMLLWDVKSGEAINTFRLNTYPSENDGLKLFFSPDSKKLVTNDSFHLTIWSIENAKSLKTIEIHTKEIGTFRFVPPLCISLDGQYLAFVNNESFIELWDLQSVRCLRKLQTKAKINQVCFSPDSRWLFSYEESKTIRIWRTIDGVCCFIHDFQESALEMSVSPDSRFVLLNEPSNIHWLEMDWKYEFPGWTDWDKEARPYLEIFLTLHPNWTEDDFHELIQNLQYCGFGYIRPSGIRKQLEKMER